MNNHVFEEHDKFTIDAEIFLTGKKYRYNPIFLERKIKVSPGQVRSGLEVSSAFYIECSRSSRYNYPLETKFRLDVKICKKTNKTAFYNYYDEYYLRSEDQKLESIEEYDAQKYRWRIFS